MPNPVAAFLNRRPRTGLAAAAFWLAIGFAVVWPLGSIAGAVGVLFVTLQVLIGIALVLVAIPLLLRLIRSKMLWSLRSKLIVTYLLIGLAPVLMGLVLVGISAYIAAGQFAIHLAETRIQTDLDQMLTGDSVRIARVVTIIESSADPAGVEQRFAEIAASERAAALANPRSGRDPRVEAFFNGAPALEHTTQLNRATPLGLPPWAFELPGGSFHGLVLDSGELYLVAIQQQRLRNRQLFTLLSSRPVDSAFMDSVAEGLGRARVFTEQVGSSDAQSLPAGRRSKPRLASIVGGEEPAPLNLADVRVRFFSTTAVTDWDTGTPSSVPLDVVSRPSLLYLQLFGGSLSGIITSALRVGIISLCLLFALIEALALVLALRVSRTMTASVTDLYKATLLIDSGELNHRITVTRTDQLAELSRSFNRMTGSLQRLLLEQQEKERLQSELSIAQEVQANLFPTAVRDLPTLQLHGVCRPARSVSGDYYDFLTFYKDTSAGRVETGLGIAVGDISGKGISAALLMANLHSAVRAYLFLAERLVYAPTAAVGLTASRDARAADAGALFESPSRIMALLNRHLYRSTQPEKYATLFLAHYDVATAWLTYSTAGQLPPLLLGRDGVVRRLDCGGTVVGLMDGMSYEEGRFQMHPGDILVAYSDGVTEPENDFGDFGEERLLEVVARYRNEPLHVISAQVMQALDAWIGAEEQPDDITLVLARQL